MKLQTWKPGTKLFIRTVTLYFVGELVAFTKRSIVLQKCSWVAETGRFNAAMRSGDFNEVEPFPMERQVRINRGAIIDASEFPHKLPTTEK
jgi:hypothetical protein